MHIVHMASISYWSCVLKCGVAHTWRPTSASLNYERFHGDQVKLKKVHFVALTLKEGSKYTYIIREALV